MSIRQHTARVVLVFAAVALAAAMAVPAVGRASADHAPLQALFGTVVEVNLPDEIIVATNSGVVTVIVPNNQALTGDITATEDISEGDRVVASVHVGADGVTTADRMLIVPDLTRTVTRHILGVVLEEDDGQITVQDRDGNTVTIDVPEGIAVPEPGTAVTAVAQLDRRSGRLVAQAFERVEDVVQRLQEAKDRATDAGLKEELEQRLERARDQHLSALERTRQSLERARRAVDSAIADHKEAERRLAEIQTKFDNLRQRYVQEASSRNERLPELRVEGTLSYAEDEWSGASGVFALSPRINDADSSVSRTFLWNENTLAIVEVEVRETDPEAPAVTATTARSVALPLNDVKSLIPSGSKVLVQYDPNHEPALTTLLTVLPPELPEPVKDALERERLRSISGFITLVEETPDLASITGVVVLANREHDVKFVTKVTGQTEVEIDGQAAQFNQLAAGMHADIEFDAPADGAGVAQASMDGRLNALRVRARTVVDQDETHIAGVISSLDPETRTVSILPRDGDVVRAVVDDSTVIFEDDVEAPFGALSLGDLVLGATRYNSETHVLSRLVVRSQGSLTFAGTLTGVSHAPEKLTIATAQGQALVAFIIDSTQMRNEAGDVLSYSDLAAGNRVIKGVVMPVQRDDQTLLVVTELLIGQPQIVNARGVVSRVNVEDSEVLLHLRSASIPNIRVAENVSIAVTLSLAENNRSVLFKNGEQIRNLDLIMPDDIVDSVSYVTSTRTILKISVVSPNLQRVRGVVSAVTGSGLAVDTSDGRILGLGISGDTFVALNGRRVDSLRPVQNGDIVSEAIYIARPGDVTQGSALRITIFRPAVFGSTDASAGPPVDRPSVATSVSGVIEQISDGTWVIAGRKFVVNSDTRYFGERPQKGLVARATLVSGRDGRFVASSISVAGRPDTNPSTRPVEVLPVEPGDSATGLVRILGRVQAVKENSDGNLVVVIDGARITMLDNTVVAGEPQVGVSALAVVRRAASGLITGVNVSFGKPAEDSDSGDNESRGRTPTRTPEPSPAPEPTGSGTEDSATNEDEDTSTVSGSTGTNDGAAEDSATGVQTQTIVVEEVSGRLVRADGRLYFLKSEQVSGLEVDASITVRARAVPVTDLDSVLSLLDRLLVTSNPLYLQHSTSASSVLYVAE